MPNVQLAPSQDCCPNMQWGGLFYLEPICPCYVTISVPMYWTKLHVMRVYIHRMYDDCFSCIFRLLHNFRRQAKRPELKLSSCPKQTRPGSFWEKMKNFRSAVKSVQWAEETRKLVMSNQILLKHKKQCMSVVRIAESPFKQIFMFYYEIVVYIHTS